MIKQAIRTTIAATLTIIIVSACGSGGGGTTPTSNTGNTPTSGGTPESTTTAVSSTGVITGFGSVFINGIKYEVENDTVVAIEDESETVGDDGALRLGMKVRINADEDDNGQRFARRIEFDEDLKGPAVNIIPDVTNSGLGTFSVLSVTVTVDANTIFDDDVGDTNSDGVIDINDLAPGVGRAVVEISGYPSINGILATRIDRLNPPGGPAIDEDEIEVKGNITSVAGLPNTFELHNGLTVNVGNSTFDGLTSVDDLVLNLFVEVKGTLVSDNEINAEVIQLEDRLGDDDHEGKFEIEGVLQSVDTTGDPDVIVINGISLKITDAGNLSSLVGKRIEIKGSFNSDGILVLLSGEGGVKSEVENSLRTEDLLASVDTVNGVLTTRLGLEITPTGLSRVEDETREIDGHLPLVEFITGLAGKGTSSGVPVSVKARGYPLDGEIRWTRVEVDDIDSNHGYICKLRGPVESFDATSFTIVIQGVTIDASDAAEYEDESITPSDNITRTSFFERIANGLVVQAIGNDENDVDSSDCVSLRMLADKVELTRHYDDVFGTDSGDDSQ